MGVGEEPGVRAKDRTRDAPEGTASSIGLIIRLSNQRRTLDEVRGLRESAYESKIWSGCQKLKWENRMPSGDGGAPGERRPGGDVRVSEVGMEQGAGTFGGPASGVEAMVPSSRARKFFAWRRGFLLER